MIDDNRKFDDEESEYHFSDEDVSYDVEQEVPQAPPPAPKKTLMERLNQRKRMLITIGIFIVLIFIVYRIISPSQTVPSTEIVAQNEPVPAAAPVGQLPAPPTPAPVAPVAQVAPPPSPIAATASMPAAPGMAPTMGTPSAMPQAVAPQVPPTSAILATETQASIMANEKLIRDMQTTYNSKLEEFAAQNKFLQDQMQNMNSRVVNMENQLNQLIQAWTRANQQQSSNNNAAEDKMVKSAYNVQAIIPGRAWLRSDNGDTVTVAEGDTLKNLGRVTKIDPYDGIVEINTGNKVISLSYGATG